MSKKTNNKDLIRKKQREKLAKKEAMQKFLKSFMPLMIAVVLWIVTLLILHLPSIEERVMQGFVKFTLDSALLFGKVFFLPVESFNYPNITVNGYTMKIVMECTAYNFYVFVIYLSLLSPVKWKQRLITLVIFLLAVFIVNNLRFITMGYIGNYSAQMFHIIHDYLWNILFGFMVFLIWAWRYKDTVEISHRSK